MKPRRDYELADLRRKLKALDQLIEEWDTQLPIQFFIIAMAVGATMTHD